MTERELAEKADIDLRDSATVALLSAWVLALSATLATLFIGEVMGQHPCTLCWYQRIAMFPLALILGVASWRDDYTVWRYALPIAGAGLLVSTIHSLVYFGVIPEAITQCGVGPSCTDAAMTIFGLAIPVLSFGAFLGVTGLLLQVRRGSR